MPSSTHIVPLLVGDPVKTKHISDILLAEYGTYVQPINYPTVPRGTELLRFTPGPTHSPEIMRDLTNALTEIWQRLDMSLAALRRNPTSCPPPPGNLLQSRDPSTGSGFVRPSLRRRTDRVFGSFDFRIVCWSRTMDSPPDRKSTRLNSSH